MTIFKKNQWPDPVPGMPATRRVSSEEWHAGTVIRVHPDKRRLVWQRDIAILVRENGRSYYEFSTNPDGECIEFSHRKDGNWTVVGKVVSKPELALGERSETSPAAQKVVAPEYPGYHRELPVIPGVHQGDLDTMKVAPNGPGAPVVWLNLAAMKRHLSCSHTAIYAMVKKGLLPQPYKLGSSSRWAAHEVDAWILEKCKSGEAVQKQTGEAKYVRPTRANKNNRIAR
jgi:predicted DNA-binding transcriptional regulator AlpA